MEKADFENLKKYYRDLKDNRNKEQQLFYNTDRTHNALVMSCIMDSSTEVKMYCGEFSLFREKFKQHVEETFTEDQINDFSPIRILYDSLRNFLNAGKKIYVIMENDIDSLKSEPTFNNIISQYISKNIFFYKADDSFKANYHFTVGDLDRYRRETGPQSHSAICSMRDSGGAKIMLNQFDFLLKKSLPVLNN